MKRTGYEEMNFLGSALTNPCGSRRKRDEACGQNQSRSRRCMQSLSPGRGPLHNVLPLKLRNPEVDGRIPEIKPLNRHSPDLPHENGGGNPLAERKSFLDLSNGKDSARPPCQCNRRTGKRPENIDDHHAGNFQLRIGLQLMTKKPHPPTHGTNGLPDGEKLRVAPALIRA